MANTVDFGTKAYKFSLRNLNINNFERSICYLHFGVFNFEIQSLILEIF